MFEKDRIPYYRCLDCHFAFSRPTQNANLERQLEDYEPAYINYLMESAEDIRNFTSFLAWMRQFVSFDKVRVLDVGTGSGKLVRFLHDRGIDAYGIEPARSIYSEFLGGESLFFCTAIEDFNEDLAGGKFDIVLACDVIEHVEQPNIFLKHVQRVLKPGGKLFVSTPDADSLVARILGSYWHHYNGYHLSYFSRKTIAMLAGRCGFDKVGFARLPRLMSAGYIVKYACDFLFRSGSVRQPRWAEKLVVPVNLYDIMYVAFEKKNYICA